MTEPMRSLVSFVVPTKNAGRTLERCLVSLQRQDHRAVEIIVVDNGSADDTWEIASRHADIVVEHGPERSAQRNEGARLARGDVVAFIDADMVLEPAVARECAERFAARPNVGALVLPELAFGTGYLARCRALEKRLYLGDPRVESARAFRAEAFSGVGGYDLALNAFEDWDIADRVQAAGWVTDRIDAYVWHDEARISAIRQFRKKRYYGKQSGRYLARHDTPRRRRVVRSSLWRNPRLLLSWPWLLPGLVWLKFAEAAGILTGARAARRASRTTQMLEPLAPSTKPRVLHVVGEFNDCEGIGRSILQSVAAVDAEHHLLAARVGVGAEHFVTAHAAGGSMATFPVLKRRRMRTVMHSLSPDVVHLHGGPLVSFWAPLRVLRAPTMLASIYVWPRVPSLSTLRRVPILAALRSQVLRPRIVVCQLLGGRVVAALLRRGGVRRVRTPDRNAQRRLAGRGLDVELIPVAVAPDRRRARLDSDRPIVVFAGRSETVRGIDTILDAVPALRQRHRGLRVRLLLLVRPEAESIAREVHTRGLADVVQVLTTPVEDLRQEFAAATVAALPFKFDHVTIPPALTVAEAMSVGLPVVGTDVACITALLRDDENGVVVPVGDAEALATAIGSLIDDPQRWQRLALGAARTIEDVHRNVCPKGEIATPEEGTVSRAGEEVLCVS